MRAHEMDLCRRYFNLAADSSKTIEVRVQAVIRPLREDIKCLVKCAAERSADCPERGDDPLRQDVAIYTLRQLFHEV